MEIFCYWHPNSSGVWQHRPLIPTAAANRTPNAFKLYIWFSKLAKDRCAPGNHQNMALFACNLIPSQMSALIGIFESSACADVYKVAAVYAVYIKYHRAVKIIQHRWQQLLQLRYYLLKHDRLFVKIRIFYDDIQDNKRFI